MTAKVVRKIGEDVMFVAYQDQQGNWQFHGEETHEGSPKVAVEYFNLQRAEEVASWYRNECVDSCGIFGYVDVHD